MGNSSEGGEGSDATQSAVNLIETSNIKNEGSEKGKIVPAFESA